MTLEQQQFAEDNHNLIYSFIHSKGLPVDEFYDIVAIGYVKAVATFDPSKSKFSIYAYSCMLNEVRINGRRCKSARYHNPNGFDISLDSLAHDSNNEDVGPLENIVQDMRKSNWEDEIHLKILIDGLSDIEQRIVEMRISGMTQKEIGDELNYSQSYISRILHSVKIKMT